MYLLTKYLVDVTVKNTYRALQLTVVHFMSTKPQQEWLARLRDGRVRHAQHLP